MVGSKQTKSQLLVELEELRARLRDVESIRRLHTPDVDMRFDAEPDAVCLAQEGAILCADQTFADMFGYADKSDVVGKPLSTYLSRRSRKQMTDAITRFKQKQELPPPFEATGLRKDGTEFSIRIQLASLDPHQETALTVIVTNITGQPRTESTRQQEQDRTRAYLDMTETVLVDISVDHTVRFINKRGCDILGCACEELIGKNWVNTCIPPAQRKEVAKVLKRLMAGETEPFSYVENSVLTRDGTERVIAWHNTVLRDSSGTIIGTLSSGDDITERKRTETALRESEQKFRCVTEQSPDGIVLADKQGNVISWNAAMEHITGLGRAEVLKRPIWEIQLEIALEDYRTPEAYECAKNSYLDLCRTGQAPWSKKLIEQTFRRAGANESTTIQSISFPIETDSGFIVGSIMRDVTEHKRSVEALQAKTEDLDRFFSLALDLLCIADTGGHFIRLNVAWERTLGYKLAEMEGSSFLDLVHPEDLDNTLGEIAKLSEGQEVTEFVNRYRCQDGSYRWIEWHAVPYANRLIYAAARDITHHRTVERTLRRQAAQLTLLNSVGREILAGLDLRVALGKAAHLIHESFGYHHVAIFIINHARNKAVMQAIAGSFVGLLPAEYEIDLGQGMIGWVAQQGERLLANDVTTNPHYVCIICPGTEPTRSELTVPICLGTRTAGVLDIQSPDLNAFDDNDVLVIETLAGQIAAAIENARLYEATQRELAERKLAEEALLKRNVELSRLYEVTRELGHSLDQSVIYETVYQAIATSIACEGMFVAVIDSTGRMLQCSYARHENNFVDTSSLPPLSLEPDSSGPQDRVIQTGEPLNLTDYQASLGAFQEHYIIDSGGFTRQPAQVRGAIRSALIVPLKQGNVVIGVMQVHTSSKDAYSSDDLQFLMALASQVAAAILNAELFARAQAEIVQRVQAEEALKESERFARSTLDGLSARIAILDEKGVILEINQAWRRFAKEDACMVLAVFEGADYLSACQEASTSGVDFAGQIAEGIRDVLTGDRRQREIEYLCNSRAVGQRWFIARVTPFPGQGPGRVVVAHEDISRRKMAETRLKEQLRFLQTLMDAIPNPVFYKDTDGIYLGCNSAYAAFRGRPVLEIVGRAVKEMGDPPEIAAQHSEVDTDLIRSPGTRVYETQSHHADGTLHDIIVHKATFTNTEGNVDGLVGIIMDITERKRIEAAEREQRTLAEALAGVAATINQSLNLDETFGSILASLARVMPHDGANIMLTDKKSGYFVVSRYCECYAEQGLPTPHLATLYPFESFPNVATIRKHGHPLVISDVQTNSNWIANPESTWVRSYVGAPIRVEGKVIGVINVNSRTPGFFTKAHSEQLQVFADQAAVAIRNATLYSELESYNTNLEQTVKQRTREMLQARERVEAILTNNPDAILLFRSDGTIEAGNLAFHQLFGYEVDALYGKQPIQLIAISYVEQMQDALDEVISKQVPARFESLGQNIDGTTFDVDIAIAPIKTSEGLVGMVCSIRDISAFKEIERMKDAFVSNVSHELRTPVANIKLNHRLLQMDPEHSDVYMDRLGREIERLNIIIEDLLRLSRLEQGRMPLNMEALDLNILVGQYVEDRRSMAASKQVSLTFEQQPELPLVRADQGLMGQVLSILLTNAFNYTPANGQVTVKTQTSLFRESLLVGFSVSDTGPGIPQQEAPHLFQRFFRGKVGRNSGAPGTGLGLAIAREIVERHNGIIELEDQASGSQGATFCVWLPSEIGGPGDTDEIDNTRA